MKWEVAAARKFRSLLEEASRRRGEPVRLVDGRARAEDGPLRRVAAWPELEIRQVGRGVMVHARAPWVGWWHERKTWDGDPMGPIYNWREEERASR